MSCGQSREIDIQTFLEDSGAVALRDFREHYPGCPDCARAVAKWSALELALEGLDDATAGPESDHPSSELLSAYLDSPSALGARAAEIERHVTDCPACRSEVQLMRGFNVSGLLAATAPAEEAPRRARLQPEAAPVLDGMPERIARAIREVLGGPVAAPAFAAALLLVLGAWWLLAGGAPESGPSDARSPQVAEESETSPHEADATDGAPIPGPGGGRASPRDGGRDAAPESLALEPTEAVEPAPAELDAPGPEGPPAPLELAEADLDRLEGTSTEPAEPAPTSSTEAAPEEILLAALDELPVLDYTEPPGARPLTWMRQYGPVRSSQATDLVEARAPRGHAGLTLDASPRLWWSLREATTLPVRVTVVDEEALEPVLRIDLRGPHVAGLHSLDLADHGVTLEPRIEHRWFVALLVDPSRPSRNPTSAGAIRLLAPGDERRAAVEAAPPYARGHTLAELGIWYDAFDFFASLAERHPEAGRLATLRDRLFALVRSER